MRLFLVSGDPAFSMLQPVQECAWHARGGLAVSEPWEEVDFTTLDDTPADFIAVDCLTMNTGADGFLVSAFARDILAPLLKDGGEFWPVRVFGVRYWWLNCLAQVEALDRERTDADWSVVHGIWGSFSWITTTRRLAFRPSQVKRAPFLFRVPEYPQGVLFAGDALQAAVKFHGLTGFKFDLAWSVGEGGVVNPAGAGFGDMFEPISRDDVESRRELAQEILTRRYV